MRELFAGHGLSVIDAKGRVAIPVSLRATLEANGKGRKLVMIARHPDSPCLIGFDRARLHQINDRIDHEEDRERVAGRPYDYYAKIRRAFGQAEETLAYFFGTGQFFEIWNPRPLLADAALNPDAAEGAEWFMTEKGLI
jgi:MraZ protein